MALRGKSNSSSSNLVSGSSPTPATPTLTLSVIIRPPMESPYTRQITTIVFDWEDNTGRAVDVSGFGIGSLRRDPGGEIFRFTGSGSRYTCDVRFSKRTGPWTITVPKDAATLVADPAVTGPNEDTSTTIQLGINAPTVKIGVPTERPVTQRPVPLTFDWVYTDGSPAPVENFVLADVETDVGTIANFAQVPDDPSKYTAELNVPAATTEQTVTITVPANTAQIANSAPAIQGPLDDVTKTFDIAAPTAVATITGADSVCVLEKTIIDNDALNDVLPHLSDNAGGAFTGILECVNIDDYLYLVAQVRKFTQTVDDDGNLVTPANPENFLADRQAGAVLFRVDTANCQFETLRTYTDITLAARSLKVDENTLYFIEGSHYMYEAQNIQFDDPDWREKVGIVYKIEHPSSTIQPIGRNWRSATTTDNPNTEAETDYWYGVHGGTPAPMSIVNDVLHLITGFGNFDNIGQSAAPDKYPVNRIGNHNWIQYDNQINQQLSEIQTNGRTGFDVLKDVAVATASVLGFKNDTFFLHPREPQQAVNGSSGITETQTTLTAKGLNWGSYPDEGWLYVDGELIKHTGADANGQFTSLVRGAEATTAAAVTGAFDIRFVDHILSLNTDTLEMPIKSVVATNDTRQHYNRIRLRYGDGDEVLVADATSITENGARLFESDVPLDSHQGVWAEWLANTYLARFKDIQQTINLTLKPTFFMAVGDVVYLKIPERMHLNGTLCQVLEIKHTFRQPPITTLKLITLP